MSTMGENDFNQEKLLCTRKKSVDVFLLPSGRQFRAIAEMADGVHHMRINLLVNQPSLRIKEISCEMLSVPDSWCREAKNCLEPLLEKRVAPGLTRELNNGTSTGCTHMINLFHEACYNLIQAQGIYGKTELEKAFPGITEEQIYKIFLEFRPELKNSCVRYVDASPFMEKVEKSQLPERAE
jgi:hypothetical protein